MNTSTETTHIALTTRLAPLRTTYVLFLTLTLMVCLDDYEGKFSTKTHLLITKVIEDCAVFDARLKTTRAPALGQFVLN